MNARAPRLVPSSPPDASDARAIVRDLQSIIRRTKEWNEQHPSPGLPFSPRGDMMADELFEELQPVRAFMESHLVDFLFPELTK